MLKEYTPSVLRILTVAGQPFVEVDLSGQNHKLLQVEVHHADLGELQLQVLLLLFRWRLLPVRLRLRLPASKTRSGGPGVKQLPMT